MKKFLLFCLSAMLVAFFAGCSAKDSATEDKNEKTAATTETKTAKTGENKEAVTEAEHSPLEVQADTVCDSCNMKVYEKDHKFGVFSAQGVTQDGKNVFFDDIGCLLNYERKNGEALAAEWIRDYETLEWTEQDKSVPVKTNLESPMKWGYIMFDTKEKAEAFAADEANSALVPEITEWTVVDNAANGRFQMKMQAQKQAQQGQEMDQMQMGH
ncbi:nitrous oxide reductase accessory protein NosL [Bacillus benzoevorans]|uniref:NosL n=1 Tax=Bacillus benzoevorans TaxID=1456 RepID=A0A7X0HTP5_9BACI|nr:nitrous oxide reductase accessory protein NosL [Bacillus benzoevorans]MBB6446677.1 hypothetical protein [Bacillus benzoevorans]